MTNADAVKMRRCPEWTRSRLFLLLLRCALGGVFIYAGLVKMENPAAFADSVASFRVLPPFLISIFALGLPVFEVTVGLMVLVGIPRGVGALSVILLSGIFVFALAQALVRGLEVDCGCFGNGTPSIGKTWLALSRASVLGATAFWIYRHESK